VKEGRPDIFGKPVDQKEIDAQISKVATETARAMTAMTDDVLNMQVAEEDGSDDGSVDEGLSEDEEMDEDFFSQVEDLTNDVDALEQLAKRSKIEEETTGEVSPPVTSCVPPALSPTFVDILLPPSKPAADSNLVSPFTWPCLVAAVCRRVLHYFKKRRNEADEDLRYKKLLPTMTQEERERREKVCAQRVFSECFAFEEENQ
jgi:hypothetical protein